jgi:hypothetical protein
VRVAWTGQSASTSLVARQALRRGIFAVGLVVVLLLAVWGGYTWGQRTPHVSVLTGEAYYSGYQAEATVNGWAYDIPLNVAWIGADGVWNQNGRPACLRVGRHPLTFGAMPVGYSGINWRQVVWVSCAG